jgi:hypothetical protein
MKVGYAEGKGRRGSGRWEELTSEQLLRAIF